MHAYSCGARDFWFWNLAPGLRIMRLVVDVFLSRGAHDNNLGCWTMRVCDFMVAARLKTRLGRGEFGGRDHGPIPTGRSANPRLCPDALKA